MANCELVAQLVEIIEMPSTRHDLCDATCDMEREQRRVHVDDGGQNARAPSRQLSSRTTGSVMIEVVCWQR